jgi:hypothetical protein
MHQVAVQIPDLHPVRKPMDGYEIRKRSMNGLYQYVFSVWCRISSPDNPLRPYIHALTMELHLQHLRGQVVLKEDLVVRILQQILISASRGFPAGIFLDNGSGGNRWRFRRRSAMGWDNFAEKRFVI